MAGIYIHIPFCKSFCTYCGFYSVKSRGWEDKFITALQNEISLKRGFFNQTGVLPDTLYIGGGTPSVLSAGQLARVAEVVKAGFEWASGRSFHSVYANMEKPGPEKGECVRDKKSNPGRNTPETAGKDARETPDGNTSGKREENDAGTGITEFTVEVNPNDITPEYVRGLAAMGVNRVSMGVQSFIDRHLNWMNRRHTAAQGIEAYRILRENGIRNISLDLIFGYEGLSAVDWEYNLDIITALAPEHISAYQMSVEPGSVLSSMVRRGQSRIPPEEVCRAQYRLLQEKLEAAGYEQYEISNFARIIPGNELGPAKIGGSVFTSGISGAPADLTSGWRSRHNSSYWDRSPYLGLGPSAHSYKGRERSWNVAGIKRYCEFYAKTVSAQADSAETCTGKEILSERDVFNESLMLGLRRKEGVCLQELDRTLLRKTAKAMKRMQLSGNLLVLNNLKEENDIPEVSREMPETGGFPEELIKGEGDLSGYKIKIPPGKWFVSDGIIRELFIV